MSSMYKQNIQRLAQTSLMLSIEDIAIEQLNNPKVAEMHVLRMVVSKKLILLHLRRLYCATNI